VERRIGKWLGRNTAAEKVFQVQVINAAGNAVGLAVSPVRAGTAVNRSTCISGSGQLPEDPAGGRSSR
jgi:hypothetical protein